MEERPPETLITRTLPRAREARPEPPHASLNRNDILIALFKHKKKIALFAAAGLLAAAIVIIGADDGSRMRVIRHDDDQGVVARRGELLEPAAHLGRHGSELEHRVIRVTSDAVE